VIYFLGSYKSEWTSRGHEEINISFNVLPSEYLSFSEYDIESETQ
jgi:hypothetical protein